MILLTGILCSCPNLHVLFVDLEHCPSACRLVLVNGKFILIVSQDKNLGDTCLLFNNPYPFHPKTSHRICLGNICRLETFSFFLHCHCHCGSHPLSWLPGHCRSLPAGLALLPLRAGFLSALSVTCFNCVRSGSILAKSSTAFPCQTVEAPLLTMGCKTLRLRDSPPELVPPRYQLVFFRHPFQISASGPPYQRAPL